MRDRELAGPYRFHAERFRRARAPFTSRASSQDTGATLLYQGQTVWLEWQSPQARCMAACTSPGGDNIASNDAARSEAGFSREGRKNCATSRAARPIKAAAQIVFRNMVSPD